MARTSAYEQVWKNARENQAAYAKAEIASQQSKLADYNNVWTMSMNNYLNAENKLRQATVDMLGTKQEFRNWQAQQYENANRVWMEKLDTALDRYREALNTEMTIRKLDVANRRNETKAFMADAQNSMANALVAYNAYRNN